MFNGLSPPGGVFAPRQGREWGKELPYYNRALHGGGTSIGRFTGEMGGLGIDPAVRHGRAPPVPIYDLLIVDNLLFG